MKKTVSVFLHESYTNRPKERSITNKTDKCFLNDTWRIDSPDSFENGPENSKVSRYILLVVNDFSKFGRKVA